MGFYGSFWFCGALGQVWSITEYVAILGRDIVKRDPSMVLSVAAA